MAYILTQRRSSSSGAPIFPSDDVFGDKNASPSSLEEFFGFKSSHHQQFSITRIHKIFKKTSKASHLEMNLVALESTSGNADCIDKSKIGIGSIPDLDTDGDTTLPTPVPLTHSAVDVNNKEQKKADKKIADDSYYSYYSSEEDDYGFKGLSSIGSGERSNDFHKEAKIEQVESNDDFGFRQTGISGYTGITAFRRKIVEKEDKSEEFHPWQTETKSGSFDADLCNKTHYKRKALPKSFQHNVIDIDFKEIKEEPQNIDVYVRHLEDSQREKDRELIEIAKRLQEQKDIEVSLREENNAEKAEKRKEKSKMELKLKESIEELSKKHKDEIHDFQKMLLDQKVASQELKLESHKFQEECLEMSLKVASMQTLEHKIQTLVIEAKEMQQENSKAKVTIEKQETKIMQLANSSIKSVKYWKDLVEKRNAEQKEFESNLKEQQIKIQFLEQTAKVNSDWKKLAEERSTKIKGMTTELRSVEAKNVNHKNFIDKQAIDIEEFKKNTETQNEKIRLLEVSESHWKALSEELLEKTDLLMTKLEKKEAKIMEYEKELKLLKKKGAEDRKSLDAKTKTLHETMELGSSWKQLAEERMDKITYLTIGLQAAEERSIDCEKELKKRKQRLSIKNWTKGRK
jgi:hypothetical protein